MEKNPKNLIFMIFFRRHCEVRSLRTCEFLIERPQTLSRSTVDISQRKTFDLKETNLAKKNYLSGIIREIKMKKDYPPAATRK